MRINLSTKHASSSVQTIVSKPLKFAKSWLFFAGCGAGLCAFELGLEARGHPRIAQRSGQFGALLKHCGRASYVALAEKGSGFAEDASVALTFFGSIHED
jgi:hypothetical protein